VGCYRGIIHFSGKYAFTKGIEMTPNEYQKLAARTECDQEAAAERYVRPSTKILSTRLSHAALGLSGESGELAYAVEKWIHYGQELDLANLEEELGDCLWYIALACNALELNLSDVMKANIFKLRTRYPAKYTDYDAKEENRDREAEMEAVRVRCEDDGVLYEKVKKEKVPITERAQYEPEPPPGLKRTGDYITEIRARKISQIPHLCNHCGGPLSDEVVRRLNSPRYHSQIFRCPECMAVLIARDLITSKAIDNA